MDKGLGDLEFEMEGVTFLRRILGCVLDLLPRLRKALLLIRMPGALVVLHCVAQGFYHGAR